MYENPLPRSEFCSALRGFDSVLFNVNRKRSQKLAGIAAYVKDTLVHTWGEHRSDDPGLSPPPPAGDKTLCTPITRRAIGRIEVLVEPTQVDLVL
jgi:hypothetical protein